MPGSFRPCALRSHRDYRRNHLSSECQRWVLAVQKRPSGAALRPATEGSATTPSWARHDMIPLTVGIEMTRTIPDTPAGRIFAAWLSAFNSGDRAQLEAFAKSYRFDIPGVQTFPLESALNLRRMSGGFTLVRVEQSEPLSITALLAERDSDTIARRMFTLSADDPRTVVGATLLAIPRPADLALPRLTNEARAWILPLPAYATTTAHLSMLSRRSSRC